MYEGKKVFFVLPHEIVREHIIEILSENEYEVYILNNQEKVDSLVNRFPDSILYVNIDGTLSETEWKSYLKGLLDRHGDLQIGVLSGRLSDPNMINSYIMDVGINCGVIQLRQGVKECSQNMLKVLEANEAKGRRKYLRYQCGYNDNITLNFALLTSQQRGHIMDISSVGLSFVLDESVEMQKNTVIKDVQLKLNGVLLTTDCVLMGSRDDQGTLIYVLLFRFTPERKAQRSKIRNFIHSSLQKELNKTIA
ncbi:MAG: PilZ domain-containing protein [Spirochaetales bacterium]|nr:PilZ domain-containing protein [Spirochaetales bacterium]